MNRRTKDIFIPRMPRLHAPKTWWKRGTSGLVLGTSTKICRSIDCSEGVRSMFAEGPSKNCEAA